MLRLKQSNLIALIATFCVAIMLIAHTQASPLDITTATELTSEESTTATSTPATPSTCPYMGACGWGVYGESKKKIKYFIRNTCRCSSDYGCLLDDDDLSLSAFIYRCKERKSVAT